MSRLDYKCDRLNPRCKPVILPGEHFNPRDPMRAIKEEVESQDFLRCLQRITAKIDEFARETRAHVLDSIPLPRESKQISKNCSV